MSTTVRSELASFHFSNKPKSLYKRKAQNTLLPVHVHLGPLLDSDSDLDTPSPLTLCFDTDLHKHTPASSPLTASTTSTEGEWDYSDSDSDDSCDDTDEGQVISIPASSAFHIPHPPPSFKTHFEVPPILREGEPQVIEIPASSEFYTPHTPPTFRTTFELPPIPSA
ncbi:hypothetical protein MKEN_01044400 [Mycena kentingensis (nom. inval.)]|nr:hypothetical protein MKEN_01044400 [Mycena kentingensis (nom. inval.)]